MKELFTLRLEQLENFFVDQVAHSLAAQVVIGSFIKGSLNQFLDEQAMHFTAAQKTFRGIDDAVHEGAVWF